MSLYACACDAASSLTFSGLGTEKKWMCESVGNRATHASTQPACKPQAFLCSHCLYGRSDIILISVLGLWELKARVSCTAWFFFNTSMP